MAQALKEIYDSKFISRLSETLAAHSDQYNEKTFAKSFAPPLWRELELKERMRHITKVLKGQLPFSYTEALKVVLEIAPSFTGLAGIVFPDFVATYGLEKKHLKRSLKALKILTPFSTSEFAIRPFLIQYPLESIAFMNECSKSSNEHVRRFASEGMRSRLPWALKVPLLIEDPRMSLKILEHLKDDGSFYVRKSVANALNDISKDHPELILQKSKEWLGLNEKRDWIVRHGLRTLLKKGNQEALKLFGHQEIDLEFKKLSTLKEVRVGHKLAFKGQFILKSEENVRIEYAIGFLLKNGNHFYKVFKLTQKILPPGHHHIEKIHSFKTITTRTYYPGRHYIRFIINGVSLAEASFNLKL